MKKNNIAIFYDRDHKKHPFLKLLLDSLSDSGNFVTIFSSSLDNNPKYVSYPIFSFQQRDFNWNERLKAKNKIKYYFKNPGSNVKFFLEILFKLIRKYYIFKRDYIDTNIPYLKSIKPVLFSSYDIYIASRPQVLPLLILRSFIKKTKIIYYPYELYGEQIAKPNRLLLKFEIFALKNKINLLITQNLPRLNFYIEQKGYSGKSIIIRNFKSNKIIPDKINLREILNIPFSSKLVVYEGYFIDGRKLDSLIKSLEFLPHDIYLIMIGESKGGWSERNADIITSYLNNGRLKIIPMVEHNILYNYVSDCNVGVVIYEDSCLNNIYCEPGKITDYINCGIPFIAPSFPSIKPLLDDNNLGATFTSFQPDVIAKSIIKAMEFSFDPNYKYKLKGISKKLNWDNEYRKLSTQLDSL